MGLYELFYPLGLVTIINILKLYINNIPDKTEKMIAIFNSPIDIIFLASSFLIAFVFLNPLELIAGFTYFFISIAIGVFIIIMSRASDKLLASNHMVTALIYFSINFFISLIGIFYSIQIVTGEIKWL